MSTRIPKLGEIVIVSHPEQYNGTKRSPAIVNRVWDQKPDTYINTTVLADCSPILIYTTSIKHKDFSQGMENYPYFEFADEITP